MDERSNRSGALDAATWLAPLAAGALLRLWNLPRQILLDDEMHTVSTALYVRVREILAGWKSEDPCPPLAALYRVLLESGVRFSELTFRAPIVVASLVAIVALPWLVQPLVGRRVALLSAWLLALSPVLALYGGMVRPYGVIALLAPASVLAVLRWRASGGEAWGIAWAVLAAGSLWFHLATAPLLAAPFILLALETATARWRGGESAARLLQLAAAGALAILLVSLFMIPGWGSLRALYAGKLGISRFSLAVVPRVLMLQAGAAHGRGTVAATLLFWGVTAAGVVVLARSRPPVALYVVAAVLTQWLGLAILSPWGIGDPMILDRYLIGALPLVLVLTAAGLDALTAFAAHGSRRAQALAAASMLWLLFVAGPFADAGFRRSSFQHAKDFLRFYRARGALDDAAVPAFYRSAELRSSTRPLIELPFRGGWALTRAHYVYQTLHGRPVLVAEPGGWPCDPRLRLRNHVCVTRPALLRTAARFLVVHRDPLEEERSIAGGDASGNAIEPEQWQAIAATSARMSRGLELRWGEPCYRDQLIEVWDLDPVRLRMAAPPPRRGRAP